MMAPDLGHLVVLEMDGPTSSGVFPLKWRLCQARVHPALPWVVGTLPEKTECRSGSPQHQWVPWRKLSLLLDTEYVPKRK